MAFTAGVANVLVAPSFRGFQRGIRAEVNKVMPTAGREAGAAFATGMAQGITASSGAIKSALAAATYGTHASASAAGATAGRAFAGGFATGMRTGPAAASTSASTMFAPTATIAANAGRTAGAAFIGGVRQAMITAGAASGMASAASTAMMTPVAQITAAGTGAGSGFLSRAGAALSRGGAAIAGVAGGVGARMSAAVAGAGTAAGTGFLGNMARTMGPLAAILGPAAILTGGWRRITGIEDARASLIGLGHDAEAVELIMNSALEAVLGTAYGLDEAASIAAMMVAAGIEPGEELERVLKLTADAATIANVPLAQMGEIWGAVAAGNRLSMQEVNRLQQQGVPVLQMLAEHFGVTAGEVRDMVSAGEVGFADFAQAMETNLAGAALEAGDTTSGVFRNVGAAMSRLGETILEPLMPKIRDFGETLIWLADEAGERFKTFAEWAEDNSGWLTPLAVGIGAAAVATTAWSIAIRAFGVAWKWTNRIIGRTPLGRIIFLVLTAIATLATLYETNEKFRDGVDRAWTWIKDTVGGVVSWFQNTATPAIEAFGDRVAKPFIWLWENVIQPVWNGIRTVIDTVVGWLGNTAAPAVATALGAMATVTRWLWHDVLKPVWGAIEGAWEAVSGTITSAWEDYIKPVFDTFGSEGRSLADILGDAFQDITGDWGGMAGWIADVFYNVVLFVWDLMVFAGENLADTLGGFFSNISTAWDTAMASMKAAWEGILKPAWEAMQIIGRLLWERGLKPVFDAISNGWELALLTMRVVWETVLRPVWDTVARAARDLYQTHLRPAFDQIAKMWRTAVESIRQVWERHLRPVWEAVATFLVRHVLPGVQRGIEFLDRAWRRMANIIRRPINWAINFVWNDGLKAAFDRVARSIDSNARLPAAPTIPAYAKGGLHRGGWALVGEEGPELVNFDRPGRIYTAQETAEALALGDGHRAEHLGVGGGTKAGLRSTLDGALDVGRAIGRTVGGWVRGALAPAVNALLTPLFSRMQSTVAQWGQVGTLGGNVLVHAKDLMVDWVRGKDEEFPGMDGMGGTAPGSGAWRRPSRGPITSRYGPRWGGFHAGIDIAGGGPVFAMADGTVFRTGSGILAGRTGLGIGISHGGGVFTYYGHNPVGGIRVRPGQAVSAGQHIGYQGATGNVTGVHTHVELHRGGWGRHVNPAQLGVFDSGGDLLPGMLGANLSRKPEVVLTNQVIHDINRLADGGGSGGVGVFHLYDSDDVLIGTMRGEARRALDDRVSGARQALRQGGGV